MKTVIASPDLQPMSGIHELAMVRNGEHVGVAGLIVRRDTNAILMLRHAPTGSWRLPFGFYKVGDGNWVGATVRMIPPEVIHAPELHYLQMRVSPIGIVIGLKRLAKVAFAKVEVPKNLLSRFPEADHRWVASQDEFNEIYLNCGKVSAMKAFVADAVEKGSLFKKEQGATAH